MMSTTAEMETERDILIHLSLISPSVTLLLVWVEQRLPKPGSASLKLIQFNQVPRGNHIKAQTSSAPKARVKWCKSQHRLMTPNDHETHEPLLGLMLWEMMKLQSRVWRVDFIINLPLEKSRTGIVMFSLNLNKKGW